MAIMDRFKSAFNAFTKKPPTDIHTSMTSVSFGSNQYRPRSRINSERVITSSLENRIAVDVSTIDIRHVLVDENEMYLQDVGSRLSRCLRLIANIDQSSTAFFQDLVQTLLETGHAVIVPTDTSDDPDETGSYDVWTMRVGTVTKWFPRHVMVRVYDDHIYPNESKDVGGKYKEVLFSKANVVVIENPFFVVMNEPNSTLQRLRQKLSLLDQLDTKVSSGKIDLIIQLPYVVRGEQRRAEAERRTKEIEAQLEGSSYGIAYADGTERITQLNRPLENKLLAQVEYLQTQIYGQFGVSKGVFEGTASESEMLNYYNRTIYPILEAIVLKMSATLLTQTAYSQGHRIQHYRDPFKLVPMSDMADIGDKMTRNEIMSSNEIRAALGMRPSTDPGANELRNKNIATSNQEVVTDTGGESVDAELS